MIRLYHFLPAEYALQAIRNRRIKLSRIDGVNDPFELKYTTGLSGEEKNIFEHGRNLISDQAGMVCLSEAYDSPVMWSHYADRHQGICLGFDIDPSIARKVKYINKRKRSIRNFYNPKSDDIAGGLLLFKYQEWSYEKEWRVISALSDTYYDGQHHFYKFSDNFILKQIIVGAHSGLSRADISSVIQPQRDYIHRFKVRPAFKSFSMVRQRNDTLWG